MAIDWRDKTLATWTEPFPFHRYCTNVQRGFVQRCLKMKVWRSCVINTLNDSQGER